MSCAWERALDDFEARLADQRVALRSEEPDGVAPFVPPPAMGPLPESLRSRAEDLLRQANRVKAELTAVLDSTTREMQVVRRFAGTSVGRPATAFVDSTL